MARYHGHNGNKHVMLIQRSATCFVVSYRLGDEGMYREKLIADELSVAYAYYNELLR